MRNSSRRLAVATSIALAVSSLGGVALAGEAADTTQPAALEAQAEETAAEETTTEVTAEEVATEEVATETKTDESAVEKAGADEEKLAEEKADETTTDDVTLDPMVAEYYENIYHRDTKTNEQKAVNEADIEWTPVDVSKYSSDKYQYMDEDGYRIYYYVGNDGSGGNIAARVKIGENGEFLLPAKKADSSYSLLTDHSAGWLYSPYNGSVGYGLAYSFMDADVPRDVFTETVVDKYGETAYYYPGGEYGPAGNYYLMSEDSRMTGGLVRSNGYSRYVGMYWQHISEGDDPFSGTSSSAQGTVEAPQQVAAAVSYVSPTTEVAADTAVAADTTAAAAKATPETGDPTSLAGAATAAVAAIGVLVSARALRRK